MHGPEEVPLREDELLVVYLVRDGRPWTEPFMEHYSDDYVVWVSAEKKRKVLPTSEQHISSEDVLKSRRQDREKTLRIRRLHKQLRDLRQQL